MSSEGFRTVIITGGGYGIGRATSLALAAEGWKIAIVDRDGARARETEALVREAGGVARAFECDVTDARAAEAIVEDLDRTSGPVKGLVTCAAMRHAGPITAITGEQWDETVGVILKGVFVYCKAVIARMIPGGGGTIVNVSSPDAYGRKGMVAYASAKAAVNALSLCLAADHLADRIRVNVVLPAFTLSGMTEHYSDDRLQEGADRSASGRGATPDDPAQLIRFLLSPAGETFTGGIFGARRLPT